MATIYNSDLTKEIKEGAKLQQLRDVIPSQLADKVVPVMEVNPKFFRRVNVVRSATATGTVYTAPTDKDFFITSITYIGGNNVATKNSNSSLTITPRGDASVIIGGLRFFTSVILDVNAQTLFQNFNHCPILVERGSVLAYSASDIANSRCTITGYTVDNINA